MTNHLIAVLIVIALGILAVAGFALSKRVSLYRYRNIYLMGAFPALTVILAVLFRDMAVNHGSTPVTALLAATPELFAQLSAMLFAALCLLMAVSNIALMRHEGRSLKNCFGTVMEFSFVAGTVAVYAVVEVLDRIHGAAGSGVLRTFIPTFLFLMMDYIQCFTLGIMVMGWIAARQRPAYDKDYIIIPGCSIRKDGGLLPLLRGRVNRAMRYAWEQEIASRKPVYYVPSGGQGADEVMSEGSAMGFYLLTHSAEENEVFPEKLSANTRENFLFSKQLIDSLHPNAKVAFATTNYHVLRCGLLARAAGLDAEGIASSTKWYFWPNGFARETAAIIVMSRRLHLAALPLLAAAGLILSL